MKSAYELAMERLSSSEPTQKLSESQKAQIGELDSIYKAKLAERETFLHSLIVKAQMAGDGTEMQVLKEQLGRDLESIRDEWQTKKDKVWKAS